MKKRFSPFTIVVILTLVVALVLAFTVAFLTLDDGKLFLGSKANIADFNMEPSGNWQNCIASFTITNLYNSEVTVIGSEINGDNFGYLEIKVPPGQTKNASIPLNGLIITKSNSYETELTITFDDGSYEVYSQTFAPPKYAGAAMMDKISYNMVNNQTFISVTIENTGNIPLTKFRLTMGDYQTLIDLETAVKSKDQIQLTNEPVTGKFDLHTNYPVLYEFIFADESIFSATNTVTFS